VAIFFKVVARRGAMGKVFELFNEFSFVDAAKVISDEVGEPFTESHSIDCCLNGKLSFSIHFLDRVPVWSVRLFEFPVDLFESNDPAVTNARAVKWKEFSNDALVTDCANIRGSDNWLHRDKLNISHRRGVYEIVFFKHPCINSYELLVDKIHQNALKEGLINRGNSLSRSLDEVAERNSGVGFNNFTGLVLRASSGELFEVVKEEGLGFNFEEPEDDFIPAKRFTGLTELVVTKNALIDFVNQLKSKKNTNDIASEQTSFHPNTSDKLMYLVQASRKFWGKAEKDDPTTHARNSDVAKWLVDERDMSPALAAKAASIIRPEWAFVGRPQEK
jgi:hypothetical protein